MNGAPLSSRPRAFALARRRRSFGLDAPRPPTLDRAETEIAAWLNARTPQVFWLRATEAAKGGSTPRTAATLALLLPGARTAVLRIDVTAGRVDAGTSTLEAACRARRIPFCIVKDVTEARAALRRLGIETEEG